MEINKFKQEYVRLSVADGTEMSMYTAIPINNQKELPAILVFQEAFGVNSHIRKITDRFASLGYMAIAPELFHRTAPQGFEGSYTDFAALAPHFQAISEGGLAADIRACWEWLLGNDRVNKMDISCVGYCMGGRVAFLMNTLFPVKAAVSYYGARIAPELIKRAAHLHGPMLFYWGGLDKHIPNEQIDAVTSVLEKENKPYLNVKFSYADHGFNCDERASFHPKASKDAWALTVSFLNANP